MDKAARGLRLSVYRSADGTDCTNKGVTSRFTELTVVGVLDAARGATEVDQLPARSQHVEAREDAPAVILVSRNVGMGVFTVVWYLKPVELINQHSSMGGNFAHTSDSRFSALTGVYGAVPVWDAIAVHDRVEG